jgi:hypothetical protein
LKTDFKITSKIQSIRNQNLINKLINNFTEVETWKTMHKRNYLKFNKLASEFKHKSLPFQSISNKFHKHAKLLLNYRALELFHQKFICAKLHEPRRRMGTEGFGNYYYRRNKLRQLILACAEISLGSRTYVKGACMPKHTSCN